MRGNLRVGCPTLPFHLFLLEGDSFFMEKEMRQRAIEGRRKLLQPWKYEFGRLSDLNAGSSGRPFIHVVPNSLRR
jgi:hypothetical protein